MNEMMKSVETPQWMLDLFKAIDTLDMSATSGFSVFADDIEMVFGDRVLHGIEAAKQFFVALDAPFDTVHNVTGVWQVGNAFIMQGSADLRKKGAAPETTVHVSPLFNVIWLDARGKVSRYVVTMSPDAEHAAVKPSAK
ncbi:MAG: hypothetical protein ABSC64_19885 [Candidatus Korobacteraceae bacterium]|jgi:hypothetical protein